MAGPGAGVEVGTARHLERPAQDSPERDTRGRFWQLSATMRLGAGRPVRRECEERGMARRTLAFGNLLLPVLLAGCTGKAESPANSATNSEDAAGSGAVSGAEEEAVQALRAHVAEIMTRPEREGVAEIEVQHLLVSFAGTRTSATRTKQEAEVLAAKLYARILAGEDLDALVKEFTDDNYPGVYVMTASPRPQPGKYARSGMVPAFGNIGWRLDVGQVGVAGYDPETSEFGWHIIQRRR